MQLSLCDSSSNCSAILPRGVTLSLFTLLNVAVVGRRSFILCGKSLVSNELEIAFAADPVSMSAYVNEEFWNLTRTKLLLYKLVETIVLVVSSAYEIGIIIVELGTATRFLSVRRTRIPSLKHSFCCYCTGSVIFVVCHVKGPGGYNCFVCRVR